MAFRTLSNKKKKRRRKGKKVNLIGEEDSGPQSYSPKCIRRAKAVQAEIEAKEQANSQRIADKKVQAAVNKVCKEAIKKS